MRAGLTAEGKAIQSKTKQTQTNNKSKCSEKKPEATQPNLPTLLAF